MHSQEKRATPMNFAKYKLSIQLHKIYNGNNDNDDWHDMNVQQNFNSRNEFFHINDFSNIKVGKKHLMQQTDMPKWINQIGLAESKPNSFQTEG